MAGIFGGTPAAVRQQMIAEQLGQANMIGNLGFGGRGALAGLQVGQGIGGILGAPEDPRLAQAQKLQQLEQEAAQAGLEPGTQEFTRWVVPRVTAAAGQQAGIQAFQMASELEAQRAELEGIRGAPQAAQAQAENMFRALVTSGVPEGQAAGIAGMPEVAEAVLKNRLKPEEATALQKDVAKAFPGDPQAQQQAIRDALAGQAKGRGFTIINPPAGFMPSPGDPARMVPIPGGPQDPERISPAEARAARENARKIDIGITAAQELVQILKNEGPPVLPGGEASISEFLRGDVIAAIAAAREMGVIQEGEARRLESQIPPTAGLEAGARQAISSAFGEGDALIKPLEKFIERAIKSKQSLPLQGGGARPAAPALSDKARSYFGS